MGAINTKSYTKKTKNRNHAIIDDLDQEDSNPIFENICHVRVITYSCFALQNLFVSIELMFPKELLKEILLQMREIPKAKKSKGYVTIKNETWKIILFGADAGEIMAQIVYTSGIYAFSMRDLFIKYGQGYLLLFALDDRKSFGYLEEIIDAIKRIKPQDDFPMVVVGTRKDSVKNREITALEAIKFAKSCGPNVPYLEISAKNYHEVEECFFELFREISLFKTNFKSKIKGPK